MSVPVLLADLHHLGITTEVVAYKIRCRGPKSVITGEVKRRVRDAKESLLAASKGLIRPAPSILRLANLYPKVKPADFRRICESVTGRDPWEQTPSWLQLYLLEAELRSTTALFTEGDPK